MDATDLTSASNGNAVSDHPAKGYCDMSTKVFDSGRQAITVIQRRGRNGNSYYRAYAQARPYGIRVDCDEPQEAALKLAALYDWPGPWIFAGDVKGDAIFVSLASAASTTDNLFRGGR